MAFEESLAEFPNSIDTLSVAHIEIYPNMKPMSCTPEGTIWSIGHDLRKLCVNAGIPVTKIRILLEHSTTKLKNDALAAASWERTVKLVGSTTLYIHVRYCVDTQQILLVLRNSPNTAQRSSKLHLHYDENGELDYVWMY